MLHVLGVDEYLERPPSSVLHDVVECDVERVLALRPADLVGLARQCLRPAERLRHIDDTAGLKDIAKWNFRRLGRGSRQRRRKRQFGLLSGGVALDWRGLPLSGLEHRSDDLVRTISRASFATQRVGLQIDVLEAI